MCDVVDQLLASGGDAATGIELDLAVFTFNDLGGNFLDQAGFLKLLKGSADDVSGGHTRGVGHSAVVFLATEVLGKVSHADGPVSSDLPQDGPGACIPPIGLGRRSLPVHGGLDKTGPIGHGNGVLFGHGLGERWVKQVSGDVKHGRHNDTPSNLPTVRPYMKSTGAHGAVHAGASDSLGYKPS